MTPTTYDADRQRQHSLGLGRDREMKESAWTELLLKHGYAEWGESDRKRR
jgi:hypothetical protein